jgi:hypothetical protein
MEHPNTSSGQACRRHGRPAPQTFYNEDRALFDLTLGLLLRWKP